MRAALDDTAANLTTEAFYGAASDIRLGDSRDLHGLLIQGVRMMAHVLAHVENHRPPHSVHPFDTSVWNINTTAVRHEHRDARQNSVDLAHGF